MFIRHKTVKGRVYAFEVESYRQAGKVRHRSKSLGFVCMADDWPKQEPAAVGTTKNGPKIGTRIEALLYIGGRKRRISAKVVAGTSLGDDGNGNLIRIPYGQPGRVTLSYEWNGQEFETETSLENLLPKSRKNVTLITKKRAVVSSNTER